MGPLVRFAGAARARDFPLPDEARPRAPSLTAALRARPGIIAEIKPGSPSEGRLRAVDDPTALARTLLDAGARGISALTVPEQFGGSADLLAAAQRAGGPTLMKDFVVTERQLDLAERAGASAVLLILPLLAKEHGEWHSPEEAIAAAHARGLEVLLEVYDDEDYLIAGFLDADMVGINNRDLREDALRIDPDRTIGVLSRCGPLDVPVVALSGADSADAIGAQLAAGARGVLVGSALMKAEDPAAKLRELLEGVP